MRVAIVDPASWSLAYDEPLAAALARAGCEVTVYCTPSPHGAELQARDGVRVDEAFYRSGYGLGVLPRRLGRAVQHPLDLAKLTRRLRTEAHVVLVQWMPGRRVDARAWARLARDVPVTFTAHNAQERNGALDPAMLRGFAAVIAHSDGGAQALREAGLERVWRMTLGAYTQYAEAPDPDVLPIRIAHGVPMVLLPGLLREYKGVDVLLAAWPAVRAAVPDARLVVAGRPMGAELPEQMPAGAELLPRFVSESELGWLLRRASVCCLPYKRIDMSGIAASALACGTPLVLSDVGGFAEFVGRGGVVVPPNDPRALAVALIDVLGTTGRRAALAQQARTASVEHYSWDAVARTYLERFGELGISDEADA